jgi:hypothetical protein
MKKSNDCWDGYSSTRKELMSNNSLNVYLLSIPFIKHYQQFLYYYY